MTINKTKPKQKQQQNNNKDTRKQIKMAYTPVHVLRQLVRYRESLILIITPLLFGIMLLMSDTKEARCGYVIILMAIFWMTEAVPIAVTALIPVFAFPLLGVLGTSDVCIVYMKETNMMFLGGLTVAIAVEHCNLHRRIALRVIMFMGQSPRLLMFGFMVVTCFLSMWISNTATTAMMVPIVDAILSELYAGRDVEQQGIEMSGGAAQSAMSHSQLELVENEVRQDTRSRTQVAIDPAPAPTSTLTPATKETHPEEHKGLTTPPPDESCRALRDMCFLATAYSANIGGTGSLTGTGPNLVVKAVLESYYTEPTGLNFLSWMAFNIPGMIICILLSWYWLQFRYIGFGWFGKKNGLVQDIPAERKKAVKMLIEDKYKELGPMRVQEIIVLVLFIVLVLLWLFRAPEFIDGWASYFYDWYGIKVGDATPAMLVVFVMFCLPAKLNFMCFRREGEPERDQNDKNEVITWRVVQEKIPWGIVLLLGGGFAMAEGADKSGLSKWLGDQLYVFNGVNKILIVLIVTLVTAMVTEVASNTATASIVLPVLNQLASNIEVHPLYLMLPAAVCCSYAFMLPVATPPNAIVFAAANMKSGDMMKAGFVMNIVCVLVLNVMINTLGVAIFDLNHMPAWINSTTTV